MGWDFEIRILDGRTGTIKKSAKTPFSDDDDADLIGVPYQTYAFERINPDGIRICNFRGKERPADILIKDRYCRIYALDEDLNVMWKFKSPTNTGHCPLPIDIDGDGKDELLVGYKLLDSDGQMLWSYPISEDHTDEIVAGKWMPCEDEGHFACVSGTEGFFIGVFYADAEFFDIRATLECGQVFRYRKNDDGSYTVNSLDKICRLYYDGGRVAVETDDEQYFRNYFDLDADYLEITSSLGAFDALKTAVAYGKGIRILRQDFYETVISFIVSANNNIKRIQGIIERLCERYGEKKDGYFAFPTAAELQKATVAEINDQKLGYRAEYIYETCRVLPGEKQRIMCYNSDEKIYKKVLSLQGVGPKVANCIMLFGLRRPGAYPVDRWIF